ncbi:hypothetical protein LCGC14_1103250 [marine sediment metagenome]|uniref:Uncharacterized protein n=1 Tax=marine sediment metagenome TaxID=412755 RepID=A0A0F9MDG0_9ZZZZ
MPVYNPVEVKLWMKKIDNKGDGNPYYIGNSDMEISLLDTVLKFFPPKEGEKSGVLIINNTKERRHDNNDNED